MARERLFRLLPGALYLGIPLVLIVPLLFSGSMLFGQDVVNVFHYGRQTIAQSFRAGRLPVWDPHVMAGFPLLAGMQGAVLYPPTWLCIFGSAGTFWTLSAAAHLALAGLFAHQWLEKGLRVARGAAVAGALVYMTSGYLLGHLFAGHVTYVWAYPWMPALLWRVDRLIAGPTLRRGMLTALAGTMLVLTGLPQFAFFAALVVAARLALLVLDRGGRRRERARLAGVCAGWLGLGLLLAAPQLLPTLELIGQMQRGSGQGDAFLMEHSLSLRELLGIVYPAPGGIPPVERPAYFWETCGFVGPAAGTLALAAFLGNRPERRFWAWTAAGAIVLAFGIHLPFYRAFLTVVPGAALFRAPGRYLLVFTLGSTALVSLGFDALWHRGRPMFRGLALLLAGAAGIQLFLNASKLCIAQNPRRLEWPPPTAADLQRRCGLEGRVASTGEPDLTVIGRCQAAGIDQVCGYEPMMLRRYAELMNAARGAPIDTYIPILATVAPHRILELLAVRVWCDSARGRKTIVDKSVPSPRAWIVDHAIAIESKEERLAVLVGKEFDPRRTVVLESIPDQPPPVPTGGIAGSVRVLSRAPGEYRLHTESRAPGYLVLSEAYYPGWRAEVDGTATEVVPADHLIQAIALPPGRHEIRFSYRSRFLTVGWILAALGAMAPLVVGLVRHRRA